MRASALPLQQVHLRITDAATGKPTPVRLRITDAAGTYYAPYGRLTEFATGANQDVGGNVMIGTKKWAYIDGACETLLPPGLLHIEIAKGPEYTPIDETITLLAGKLSLRFTIERWSDVRKQGWYSGDTRVHFLSPDAALLEGQAEDVAVVNLLIEPAEVYDQHAKSSDALPNILSFSGQAFARQAVGCGVAVNTLNSHMWHGFLALLHCHRVVHPLRFGGLNQQDNQTLADWCDQCHRKKGLVIWAEPLHASVYFAYGEPLADMILGKVDAIEMSTFRNSCDDAVADYYCFLDTGIVIPLVGASGKSSNGTVLGTMRTYANLPLDSPVTYRTWIEAVRAGRTYASNGPLLDFRIDDAVPASGTPIFSRDKPLRIRASVRSLAAFDWLEIVWNGAIIGESHASSGPLWEAVLEHELNVRGSGWLAVRCRGRTLVEGRRIPNFVFAHTSAIAVHGSEAGSWVLPRQVEKLMDALDAMLRWAKEIARCDSPAQRKRLCHVFEEARTMLVKKLSSH